MVKISNLPDGGDREADDVLPGVRGGQTVRTKGPLSAAQYGYLGALASAPLEENDLAANGGSVPETGIDQTVSFGRIDSSEGVFVTDNFPQFVARSTSDGNNSWLVFEDSEGNQVGRAQVIGMDGAGAPATLDFQLWADVQVSGNPVLAANNTAGNSLPTSDPAVAGQLYADSADGYTVKVSQG